MLSFKHPNRQRSVVRARRACHVLSSRIEPLESRVHLSTTVEPIDGTGNNLANPTWGATGADLIRLAAAAYSDGISASRFAQRSQRPRHQQHSQ